MAPDTASELSAVRLSAETADGGRDRKITIADDSDPISRFVCILIV
ncbi:hypothetical protein [Nocardia sp. NPDC047038]